MNPVKPRAGRVRWWIVWTLFFSTVTNYISRQTFSVLSPMIAAQYHLSHTDLAKILGAFQISYAVTWLLGGIFLDAVGTRLGLSVAVIFWSVVNILTGFAGSVFSFASFRFLLGIGEGFNWPAASKTVAEWFPSQERSVAVAIFDSGSSVGGALAALAIPLIALEFGWRWSFVFSGLLGFVWLAMWLRVYHPLDRHPRVTAEEVALIRAGRMPLPLTSATRGLRRYLDLAKNRNVWGIVMGRALTDPIWWFYVFWLPQYLSDARGFSLKRIASLCLDALRRRRYWQLYGRLYFRLLHSPRRVRGARPHLGLRVELPADPGRHSRRATPQPLLGWRSSACAVGATPPGPRWA